MKKLLKSLYQLIPFKKQLFTILKVIWKPGESAFRHLYFKGVISVSVSDTQKFKIRHYGYQIENEIFWSGLENAWEKESFKLWIQLCSFSNNIIDIGANTGIYSLIAKAVNPDAKVYAFEPVERVFKKLQANIELNKFDTVAIQKAASNYDGTAIIYDTTEEHTYSVTVNKTYSAPGTLHVETKIETIKLDTFIRQNGIKKIDLIKIDVETHEPEVLEGFLEYLNLFRPTLLIEIVNDEIGERVFNMVHKLGYLYFNIDERGSVRQVEKIGTSDYFNFLLCSSDVAAKIGLIKPLQ